MLERKREAKVASVHDALRYSLVLFLSVLVTFGGVPVALAQDGEAAAIVQERGTEEGQGALSDGNATIVENDAAPTATDDTDIATNEEEQTADNELEATTEEATPIESDEQTEAGEVDTEKDASQDATAGIATNEVSLEAQADTQLELPLDNEWQTFTPTGSYDRCAYTFTLAKTSRVRLEFQNWWSDQAQWGLYNGDGYHSYFSETVYASYPGTDTVVCYLKPGAYRLEAYSWYSGTGYFKVRGTASATSYPLRDNDKIEKAVTIQKDTTYKGLFTMGDAWKAYYKFTVSGTKKVNIDVQQPDADAKAIFHIYVRDEKNNIQARWGDGEWYWYSTANKGVLSAGTYYIEVTSSSLNSGPYTLKWTDGSESLDTASVADASVTLGASSYTYNGKAKSPRVRVVLGGKTLTKGTDYTVSYSSGRVNAGTYELTVRGIGAYTGSKSVSFTIRRASINGVTVSTIGPRAYTGKQIKPSPTVKLDGQTLTKGTDYTLSYGANKSVGTGAVTIEGAGNFTGSLTKRFTIVDDTASIAYYVHRQTYGWEKAWSKTDGQQSGTTGEAKRLEGIRIKLENQPTTGSIQYRTHIQTYGWEGDWKSDGDMSGTTGEGKRLEAIQIKLTGAMSRAYDVYYRVHAQMLGWMGWAKNGANAGTAGHAYRLEAIQIVLVPKGGAAPGATYKGVTQNYAHPFLQP